MQSFVSYENFNKKKLLEKGRRKVKHWKFINPSVIGCTQYSCPSLFWTTQNICSFICNGLVSFSSIQNYTALPAFKVFQGKKDWTILFIICSMFCNDGYVIAVIVSTHLMSLSSTTMYDRLIAHEFIFCLLCFTKVFHWAINKPVKKIILLFSLLIWC